MSKILKTTLALAMGIFAVASFSATTEPASAMPNSRTVFIEGVFAGQVERGDQCRVRVRLSQAGVDEGDVREARGLIVLRQECVDLEPGAEVTGDVFARNLRTRTRTTETGQEVIQFRARISANLTGEATASPSGTLTGEPSGPPNGRLGGEAAASPSGSLTGEPSGPPNGRLSGEASASPDGS